MPKKPVQKRKMSLKIKKRVHNFKYIKLAALGFISIVFLGSSFFYKIISQNLAHAFSYNYQGYDIREGDFFTLSYNLISDDFKSDPKLLSSELIYVDFSNKKIIKYNIPIEMVIDMPGSYGNEELKNAFYLASLGGPCEKTCSDYLTKAIQKLFGIKVDRTMFVLEEEKSLYESFMSNGFDVLSLDLIQGDIFFNVKSNLNVKEVVFLNNFIKELPKDRIIKKELTDSYIQNPLLLNEEIQDITFVSILSKDNPSITVLNASGISGVANSVSRVIQNQGGRVVSIDNAPFETQESFILSSEDMKVPAEYLKYILDLNISMINDSRLTEELDLSRSDIFVVVGVDSANKL